MIRYINGYLSNWRQFKKKYKESNPRSSAVLEFFETLLVAFIIAMVIRQFAMQSSRVFSGSMLPTLQDKTYGKWASADQLIVNKLIYHFNAPKRGDVILFYSPHSDGKQYVKRLVGLPGDTVEIRRGMVYINDQLLVFPGVTIRRDYSNYEKKTVPADRFFVLGDNRSNSSDSRSWGYVEKDMLIGKALFIYWPLSRIRWIK